MVSVFVVYLCSPAANVGDSRMSLPTAVSVYRHGDFSLDEYPQVRELAGSYDIVEHDGELLMGYPWPPALFLVPAAALADAIPGVDPGSLSVSNPNRTWLFELPMGALLAAMAVVLWALAIREEVDHAQMATRSAGALVVFTFAFSTVMWSSVSRGLSQHAAAAPFVALTLYLLVRSRRDPTVVPLLGLAVALAYVMRPTASVLVLVVTLWVLLCHRRYVVRYLAWACSVAVPWAMVNFAVYGSLIAPYYTADKLGSAADIPGHALGLLLSPSRGLVWFTPLAVLAPLGVWRRVRAGCWDSVDWVFVSVAVGVFAVVAAWPNWWGGSSFGPRLLTEAVPFICWYLLPAIARPHVLPSSRRARSANVVVLAMVSAGVLVNSQGAIARATLCWNTDPTLVDTQPNRLWEWDDPQAVRGVRRLFGGDSIRDVVIGSCSESAANPNAT